MNPYSDPIISPEELKKRLARQSDNEPCVIVDCRFNLMQPQQGLAEYAAGHIPGAFYGHLDRDLASPITAASGRHPLPDRTEFRRLVGSWGVTHHTQVVVYDHGPGAIAARLWWLLRWIGHQPVTVLDGGYKAWKAMGGSIETDVPSGCSDAGLAGLDTEHAPWISTQELIKIMDTVQLIDARDAGRFRGESEPIDAIAGHVPGAINRPFTCNLDSAGKFLDADSLKQQFLQLLGGNNVTDHGRTIVNMCGSGVTACHNIIAMELAGFPKSTLYVGSWSEWIRDETRLVATGQ